VQIFGATYMVVAPEHPLLAALTADSQRAEVDAYVAAAAAKSDLERTDLAKEKSGVQTGGSTAFALLVAGFEHQAMPCLGSPATCTV
jgi:leucyl-tRNA synthetase